MDNLQIVKSKSGLDTLTINSVYVHSKYSPENDARSQLYPKGSIIVIFGIGLGYHIINLVANNPDSSFIVYEIHESLYKRFLQNRAGIAKLDNVFLFNQLEYSQINDFFEKHSEAGSARIVFYQSPYCNIYPQICGEFNSYIKDVYRLYVQNLLTKSNFAHLWARNFFYNLPLLSTHGFITFKENVDKQNLAVIACAGPTLQENLVALSKYRSFFTLFAVDSCLKPLLKCGIIPDFVLTVDGQIYCYDDFPQNLPQSCYIVSDIISFPQINFDNHNQIFTINSHYWSQNFAGTFFNRSKVQIDNRDLIDISGTVSDYALNFVVKLGFTRIAFVGLDLSYPHLVTHLTGSPVYDKLLSTADFFSTLDTTFARIISRRRLAEGKSKCGENVFTDFVLNNYCVGFANFALNHPDLTIYNIKNGGLHIDNFINTDFAEIPELQHSSNQALDIMNSRIAVRKFDKSDLSHCLKCFCDEIYNYTAEINKLFSDENVSGQVKINSWNVLFDKIVKNIPPTEQFLIMDKIVASRQEHCLDSRTACLKMLQSCYYLVRTIQKSEKLLTSVLS